MSKALRPRNGIVNANLSVARGKLDSNFTYFNMIY